MFDNKIYAKNNTFKFYFQVETFLPETDPDLDQIHCLVTGHYCWILVLRSSTPSQTSDLLASNRYLSTEKTTAAEHICLQMTKCILLEQPKPDKNFENNTIYTFVDIEYLHILVWMSGIEIK